MKTTKKSEGTTKKAQIKTTPSETTKKISKRFKRINIAIVCAVTFGLLVLQSAVWVNRSFFNTQTFSNTVTQSITSESSRQAIGDAVVDRALAERPVARRVLGEKLSGLVASALNTSLANNGLQKLSERIQMYMTTPDSNQKSVVIDLTGMKDIIVRLAEIANKDTTDMPRLEDIPDQLVLIDSSSIPSFYNISVALLWIAPIVALLIIAGIVWLYRRNKGHIYKVTYTVAGILAASSILGLLFGPLFKPPVLSAAKTVQGRTVIANIYDSFVGLFNQQLYTVLLLAVAIALVAFVVSNYKKVKAIFGSYK